jgi:hypothetical protein
MQSDDIHEYTVLSVAFVQQIGMMVGMGAISDPLRRAIRESGLSLHEISRQTGVSTATLSRFNAGREGLTLRNADAVAKFFKLELRPATMRSRQGGS